MSKELIKNTGVYFFISIFSQGLVFLLWFLIAGKLSPSQIGIYALVMFIIELFSIINIFGLDSSITRFYYTNNSSASIFSNSLLIFSFSSLACSAIFLLTANMIPNFINGLSDIFSKNLIIFSLIIFTNSLTNFAFVHYAAIKKPFLYAKLQSIKIILFFIISLIFIYLKFDIIGIFYAFLISLSVTVTTFLLREYRNFNIKLISISVIKSVISYGFPLMFYGLFGVIIMYIGRILLNHYTDLTTLGIYSFFLNLTVQINGLWGGFNRAWTPHVFSNFSVNKEKNMEIIIKMTFVVSFFYLLILAFFIIIGELFLFKIIFQNVYFLKIHLFYIILLAPLFTGIYTVTYPLFYYENKTKRILFLSIFISLFNVLVTILMVKKWGDLGAAESFFLILLFYPILYLFAFKKIMNISPVIIKWTVFLAILMILNTILLIKTSSSVIFCLVLLFTAFISYRAGKLSDYKRILAENFKKIYG